MRHNKYEYDAFISHAVEDKIPIANELCARLEAAGLKIWYSGKELGVGDSIEKTIQNGLNRSRYGIVIFSPTYLAKNWTIREFYTLLAKEIEEQKVILPVLYNTTLDELKNKDLLMADRFAVNADRGMDFVAERLVREIRKSNAAVPARRPWLSMIGFLLLLSLLANVVLLTRSTVLSALRSQGSLKPPPMHHQSTAAGTEQLFADMQGILSQINTCTCKHDQQQATTQFARNDIPEGRKTEAGNVKRMTMAVIFQMEAGDNALDGSDREVAEEKPNAISMRTENGPFVQAKRRGVHDSGEKPGCLHIADLSE